MSENRYRCAAKYGNAQCRLAKNHVGQHKAGQGDIIRWGGKYSRADLTGKPGVIKDAARERSARVRKARGPRCSICCHPAELTTAGVCADRAACQERQPVIFELEQPEGGSTK